MTRLSAKEVQTVEMVNQVQRRRWSVAEKMRTMAGTLIRELRRKLPAQTLKRYQKQFDLFERVRNQKRSDKDKVYSLHQPDVLCISKGKAHKQYEIGRKASVVVTKSTGIIVGAMSFDKNIYDGHSLPQVLNQCWTITGTCPSVAICDRGYRGFKQVGDVQILIPGRPKKSESQYQRQKAQNRFRRRAAIEPVIGHLKHDHRMARCYLKGVVGDAINLFMASAAFNFKKWMQQLGEFFALFSLVTMFGDSRQRLAANF